MLMRSRWMAVLFDRGVLVGLLAVVVYAFVAPDHIVDGDNAEFCTLGALGGNAHPTGYPLFVLWLRVWSWLPGSPAHAAALATGLIGAAQAVVLVHACRAWGARTLSANVTAAIIAASPMVLKMYTEAEVFALNGLVAATIVWLAAAHGPLRGRRRVIGLALVAGLGMSNHLTCTMLAPLGLLGAVRGLREQAGPTSAKVVTGALAGGALLLGLSPYLYLLIAPEHQGTWGSVRSAHELVRTFLREDYGGPGSFAASPGETHPGANLVALAETIGRAWLWLPALAALGALGWNIARPHHAEPRAGWALLALAWLVAGPLLVLRFNLPPWGVARYVVDRFHLLPTVLLAVPVAAAFDGLGPIARRAPPILQAIPTQLALLVAGFAALVGVSLPYALRAHSPAVQYEVVNTYNSLPPDAVIVGTGDDFHNGGNYVQLVLKVRPDIVYVNWPTMALPWYRARAAARGVRLELGEPGVASIRVAEHVLAAGRPLYVDLLQANILSEFPTYPYGLLFRVLPRGTPTPSLLEVFEENKRVFAAFELPYRRPGPDDQWPTAVHLKYANVWRVMARNLGRAGHREEAAFALELAREIGPQP